MSHRFAKSLASAITVVVADVVAFHLRVLLLLWILSLHQQATSFLLPLPLLQIRLKCRVINARCAQFFKVQTGSWIMSLHQQATSFLLPLPLLQIRLKCRVINARCAHFFTVQSGSFWVQPSDDWATVKLDREHYKWQASNRLLTSCPPHLQGHLRPTGKGKKM